MVTQNKELRKQYGKQRKSRKKDKARMKAEDDNPVRQKMGKVYDTLMQSSQEMVLICAENHMANRGTFFVDLREASKAIDYAQNNAGGGVQSLLKALERGQEGFQESYAELAKISDYWVEFTRKHSGVFSTACTSRVDDPKNWSQVEIITTLNYHGFRLDPFPNRRILNKLVRQLIKFRIACGVVVENQPDKEQTKAISALAFGEDDEHHRKTVDDYFAHKKVSQFMAESQFSPNFCLDFDVDFNVDRTADIKTIFSNARQQHAQHVHQATFHQVLERVDNIAEIWDRMQKNPEKDIAAKISANEGTPDCKNLAIRPIKLWNFTPHPGDDESANIQVPAPLPVLGVEYMHTSQRTAGPDDLLRFSQGFRAETVIDKNNCSDKVIDLFISLLDENRSQVAMSREDATFKAYSKKVPKGWKFSILRPVDPTKASGLKMCPNCDTPATLTCSRCKIVGYCSRDCQKAQWKEHKKKCIPISHAFGSRSSDSRKHSHGSSRKSHTDEASSSHKNLSRSKARAQPIGDLSGESEIQDESLSSSSRMPSTERSDRGDSSKPSHAPSRLSQRNRDRSNADLKVEKMKKASTRSKKVAKSPKSNPLPTNVLEVAKVLKEQMKKDEMKKTEAKEELKALISSINNRNHSPMDADGPHREIIFSISNNEVSTKLKGWSDEDVAAFEEFKRKRRNAEVQEKVEETEDLSNSRYVQMAGLMAGLLVIGMLLLFIRMILSMTAFRIAGLLGVCSLFLYVGILQL